MAVLSANDSTAPFSGETMKNIPSNVLKMFVKLRRSRKSRFDRQSLAQVSFRQSIPLVPRGLTGV